MIFSFKNIRVNEIRIYSINWITFKLKLKKKICTSFCFHTSLKNNYLPISFVAENATIIAYRYADYFEVYRLETFRWSISTTRNILQWRMSSTGFLQPLYFTSHQPTISVSYSPMFVNCLSVLVPEPVRRYCTHNCIRSEKFSYLVFSFFPNQLSLLVLFCSRKQMIYANIALGMRTRSIVSLKNVYFAT